MDNVENLLALLSAHQGPLLWLSILALAGLCLLAVVLVWLRGLRRDLRAATAELAGLLREVREDLSDDVAMTRQQLQESVGAGLMRLQDLIDQRLAGLQRLMLQDAAALKTELIERFDAQRQSVGDSLAEGRLAQQRELHEGRAAVELALARHRDAAAQQHLEALKGQHEAMNAGLAAMAQQLGRVQAQSSEELGRRVQGLTQITEQRLAEISGQVDRRLAEGFEKTTETFVKVLEHLSRIDEAQRRINELSTNVVSLQEVLTDKRSRGAFGEVQLEVLVRNLLPESGFSLQHTLSNGTRVDCLLILPEPTGNVAIDAKFPLESFKRMLDDSAAASDRQRAARQFKLDIRRHIRDIADKYLIPGETADGAVLFLPAEAVFAEIHARHPDLVEEAHRARVWLVSPTTLMAVLTTARAVLKDEATRRQIHIIQDHLRRLGEDFGRFQQRMDKLALHIGQAHEDVKQVGTSARKISSRFQDIDRVQLPEPEGEDP